DANVYALTSARLQVLERIWGQDEQFLARHGERFRSARAEQHLKRARWLLVRGRTREARDDLRRAGRSPLSYRLLAALPGPLASGLLRLRRLFGGGAEVGPSPR